MSTFSDDVKGGEGLVILVGVAFAVYVVYEIYQNIQAGLSWAGNELSAGAAAVGAAASSAATAEGQAQIDNSGVMNTDDGESINF
jgi:hypothetical protein